MSASRVSPLFGASFGTLLRRYREALGLTQEALAQRAGLSARGISDLERGARQSPHRETIELLASALELPPHKRALLLAAARPQSAVHLARDASAGATPPNNLPSRLAPLIGREREARQAAETLDRMETRLLTLTGPGGAGKTSLALRVAEDALERFDDGVYLVQLAALDDAALVPPAIAAEVGARLAAPGSLLTQVKATLGEKRALLVLDNFEHVLDAAPLVSELLDACPRLTALATSREPLKIAGEREIAVAPLDQAAAIALFSERARAAQPDFAPDAEQRSIIAAICARLDHLPLAIELAAGWVRVLDLDALLARLESPLELLGHGRRDAPERQRTLRDAIAWSERLLEPDERDLFHRLAIFAGGWTLDAAEAVCGLGDAPRGADGAVLDGLARLVEKSLVQVAPSPDGPRFSMLETVREYARERLEASGDLERLARRHAESVAAMTAQLGWIGPRQDERDQRIERELPNIRAALAWTLARDEPDIGLRLATPMGRWWYSRGAFDESERWLRALLERDGVAGERAAPAGLRISALYALTLLALDRRRYGEAEALANEGLALARKAGDHARAGNMLAELGHVAEARGDLDAAMVYFEQGLAAYERPEGTGRAAEGAAAGRTLSSLGNLARAKGQYDRARDYLERALAWAQARDFSFAVASALVSLGHVAVEQRRMGEARARYRAALDLYRTLRNPASLAWLLEGVAVTFQAGGATQDLDTVARLAGVVAGLSAMASASESADWAPYVAARESARRAMSGEAYAAALAWGQALSPERAISYAAERLDATAGDGETQA